MLWPLFAGNGINRVYYNHFGPAVQFTPVPDRITRPGVFHDSCRENAGYRGFLRAVICVVVLGGAKTLFNSFPYAVEPLGGCANKLGLLGCTRLMADRTDHSRPYIT